MMTLMIIPLMIGTSELLLIVLLALLLFGGKKLPEMMRGLGQGIKSFKQGMNEQTPADENGQEETQPSAMNENADEEAKASAQSAKEPEHGQQKR